MDRHHEFDFVSKKGTQFIAAAVAILGAFSLGNAVSYTSPALISLQNSTLGYISEETQSWIGAITPIGCCCSGVVAGYLVERIGRRSCMLVVSPVFILGWLLIGFAQNVSMMLAGRFFCGLAGGSFSLAAPVYISEICEDSIRGTLGSTLQLAINCGVLFTFIVGKYVAWDTLAFICSSFPAVFIILMIFMPESPRLLIVKNRQHEASKSLAWLRGAVNLHDIRRELESMTKSIEENMSASLRDFFKPQVLKPLAICLALMFFQQWNGNQVFVFYTVTIFENVGSDLSPFDSTIIIGAVNVAASIVSSILMDKAGRRLLLLISGVMMTISLVIFGVYFHLSKTDPELGQSIGWLPLLCLIVFVISFSIGFGPIAWLMQGEILPPFIKGHASALSTSFNWLNTFIVTKAFENIKSTIGAEWAFWIFAMTAAASVLFVFFCVFETMNKSFQEIQSHFQPKYKKRKEDRKSETEF